MLRYSTRLVIDASPADTEPSTLLHAQVAAVATASRQLSADLANVLHHQKCAEKSAYTALRDIHTALDGVRSEALDAISLARYGSLAAAV